MRSIDKLSKSEELELGRRVQAMVKIKESGVVSFEDKEVVRVGELAVEKLALAYVKLVYKMASDYSKKYGRFDDYEDLVADGMVGLTRAIYKYDPERGNKFSTVAVYWVRQAISRSALAGITSVHVPENRLSEVMKLYELKAGYLECGLSDRAAWLKVQEELGLSSDCLFSLSSVGLSVKSLSKTILADGASETIADITPELGFGKSPEDIYVENDLVDRVNSVLSSLSLLELEVLASNLRETVYGVERKTIKAILSDHGITIREYKRVYLKVVKKFKKAFCDGID